MLRAISLFAVVALLSLAGCDVKVNQPSEPPVVVEKRTTVIEKEREPVKVDIDVKK